MTIVEDLLASFGWGVVVAGVINAIPNYYKTFWQDQKKQQHEKELADKKDKREEAESAAGKKKIADEAKLQALEQGRKARAVDHVIFDKERNALGAKVEQAEQRAKDLERQLATARRERAVALYERNVARQERDNARQEMDAAFDERDAAVEERDAAVEERDAAIEEIDAALEERDQANVRAMDACIREVAVASQLRERDPTRGQVRPERKRKSE
ncbi:unnamed protein product [Clonostachys rhizophaga]|uniref:Uncharacterized protein n=1 Tax=Clonostachys rhizophaga TaxID=160324 RepID=A0A9N9VCV6_9HYPO|nr:unnamed protein product [Clonostachys rhizophaga]